MMETCHDGFFGRLRPFQEDMRRHLVFGLIMHARECYLGAARILDVKTPLASRICPYDTQFALRPLYPAHDFIAALFHFERWPWQLKLFRAEESVDDTLGREWATYWYKRIRTLCEEGPFVRSVLVAATEEGTVAARVARDVLMDLLREHHPEIAELEYGPGVAKWSD